MEVSHGHFSKTLFMEDAKLSRTRFAVTSENVQEFIKTSEKKKVESVRRKSVQTLPSNSKLQNSNWTPLLYKPSSDQLFIQRKELIANWFDLWSGVQRRQFIDLILQHCTRRQLAYVYGWFKEKVPPLQHLDFTAVLPRYLSLKIFSYLDPRSLCRSACVSWHWKFITEQDDLWLPKCSRHGWYLPFEPPQYEYGAWKRHYIACILTLDVELSTRTVSTAEAMKEVLNGNNKKTEKLLKSSSIHYGRKSLADGILHDIRRPWVPNDRTPRDIYQGHKAKPNEHGVRFVQKSVPSSGKAVSGPSKDNVDEDLMHNNQRTPLSCSIMLESHEGRRFKDLVNMSSTPPGSKFTTSSRPNMSGGMYVMSQQKSSGCITRLHGGGQSAERPRLILISSRVPAAEILLDAVNFDVIPIVYEYEGTTLEYLLSRITHCLAGQLAQSVGIFVHHVVPWELCLVDKAIISSENIHTPEFLHFFTVLSTLVVPINEQGHIDIFAPLNSCEQGSLLINHLARQSRMQYCTPTGVTGSYYRVYGEWSSTPEGSPSSIPLLYFCDAKLFAWTKMAEQAIDACRTARLIVGKYFDQHQRDVVSQLVGELLFDNITKAGLSCFRLVATSLIRGFALVGSKHDLDDSLRTLGEYLISEASKRKSTKNLHTRATAPPEQGDSEELEVLPSYLKLDEDFDGTPNSIETFNDDNGANIGMILSNTEGDFLKDKYHTSPTNALKNTPRDSAFYEVSSKNMAGSRSKSQASGMGNSLKPNNILRNSHIGDSLIDRRASIAREILSSESNYSRILDVIHDVFFVPCQSARDSNRAIISAQNMQIIFTDVLQLRVVSQSFLSALRPRVEAWDMHQCLGDLFIEFTGKFKTLVNFFKTYPATLVAIERCTEQVPVFRSFLRRHERTLQTKMMTLPELLLEPVRRVETYVSLLAALRHHTPAEHADISHLDTAIKSYTNLHLLVQQCKLRCQQERDLIRIQKMIVNCPGLLESNRYFIRHVDVSRLQPPSDETIRPEMRVYQHVETIGLFLFNDAMIVAQRATHFIPFERYSEHVYTFNTCILLSRLEIVDIPDSKYVQNAFHLKTSTREWFCGVNSYDDKVEWISIANKTIESASSVR